MAYIRLWNWVQFCLCNYMYTVWVKKVAPLKLFSDIVTYGEPVKLKIILVISQTYFYDYTNFGPFMWIFVLIVSLLPVRPLKF